MAGPLLWCPDARGVAAWLAIFVFTVLVINVALKCKRRIGGGAMWLSLRVTFSNTAAFRNWFYMRVSKQQKSAYPQLKRTFNSSFQALFGYQTPYSNHLIRNPLLLGLFCLLLFKGLTLLSRVVAEIPPARATYKGIGSGEAKMSVIGARSSIHSHATKVENCHSRRCTLTTFSSSVQW